MRTTVPLALSAVLVLAACGGPTRPTPPPPPPRDQPQQPPPSAGHQQPPPPTTSTQGTAGGPRTATEGTVPAEPTGPPPATVYAWTYYPDLQLYHRTPRERWFWSDPQFGWQSDPYPPAHLPVDGVPSVPVQISGKEPTDADLARHRAEH